MQVSSGTKKNSSPNEPTCTTVTVSFNGVLLQITGTWCSHIKVRLKSDCKLNLDASENITQDHCGRVHNACSLIQVNRRNCGGGDKGRIAIYRSFGEFRRVKSYCHLYGAQGQRQAYLLPMPR
ncbi:uncharacterized protein TNCV_2848891 [Trichonephila clavipes]|nr:uncharacterized protein TNCV_2848891 [Trichonephila clavipes]